MTQSGCVLLRLNYFCESLVRWDTLFADNFRAGGGTLPTYSVWRWRLISPPPTRPLRGFVRARMLMARDELFPSYLDTARGTSFIHLVAAAPYNIIRALLNIKNVTLKWLIHLRCKHECVPKVSFLICERATVRWLSWVEAFESEAAAAAAAAAWAASGGGRRDIRKKEFTSVHTF